MLISQAARSRVLFKSILIYQLFHEYSFAWILPEVQNYCDPRQHIRGLYPRMVVLTRPLKLWSHLALPGNSESERSVTPWFGVPQNLTVIKQISP